MQSENREKTSLSPKQGIVAGEKGSSPAIRGLAPLACDRGTAKTR